MSASHTLVGEDVYYTPPSVIDLVRSILGPIELDPASDAIGNAIVGAERYYTEDDDGLSPSSQWRCERGALFANPPGGKKRLTQRFWARLANEYAAGNLLHGAAFVSFSLDTLQTAQRYSAGGIAVYPTFIYRQRMPYYANVDGVAVETKNAPKPSALTVLPPPHVDVRAFAQALVSGGFGAAIGGVWVGAL